MLTNHIHGQRRLPDIDRHIARRVRKVRLRRGMSQETLGEACGVSFQQIQKYEAGTNRLSGSRLFQVAQALGVAPADFFAGLELAGNDADPAADEDAASIDALFASREGRRIASAFAVLPAGPVRTQLVRLVEACAGCRDDADRIPGTAHGAEQVAS